MKSKVSLVTFFLALAVILCSVFITAKPGKVVGAEQVRTENIRIDGVDTGVTLTQMLLTKGAKYSLSAEGLLNVLEVPQSANVTLKVLNGGSYNWSKATMGSSALAYNKAHEDSTVLAAVNGDPWIVYHTDYDGDGVYATGKSVKHVSVSRGLMIIDGEIWATRQTDDENWLARNDNVERGTPASLGPVFAVKEDGGYMIGKPITAIQLENKTTSYVTAADGINRLPAPNSLMLYNQRCGGESFAYSDAYEIYLSCGSSAFSLKNEVTGTVTHIFQSGDTAERPAIEKGTVVLSARGGAVARLAGQYTVGDTVSIRCTVTSDALTPAQQSEWQNVDQAIAGFFTMVENGTVTGQQGNTTNYPCPVIGLKADGSVMIITDTASVDGTRSACRMEDISQLCLDLGMKTAILFDGGGSTTMITLSGDSYVRRSSAADGSNSVRAVISGMAVVYCGVDKTVSNAEKEGIAFLPKSAETSADTSSVTESSTETTTSPVVTETDPPKTETSSDPVTTEKKDTGTVPDITDVPSDTQSDKAPPDTKGPDASDPDSTETTVSTSETTESVTMDTESSVSTSETAESVTIDTESSADETSDSVSDSEDSVISDSDTAASSDNGGEDGAPNALFLGILAAVILLAFAVILVLYRRKKKA